MLEAVATRARARALSPASAGRCSSCGRRSPRTRARPSPICSANDGSSGRSVRRRRHDRPRRVPGSRGARARRGGGGGVRRRPAGAARGRRHRGRQPRGAPRAVALALGGFERGHGLAVSRRELLAADQRERDDDPDRGDDRRRPRRRPGSRRRGRPAGPRRPRHAIGGQVDRDRGERRDPERAADLLRGVDQAGGEPGLRRLRRPRARRSRSARTRTRAPTPISRKPGRRSPRYVPSTETCVK